MRTRAREGRPLDHDAGRTELDHHGRHPRLTQDGDRHADDARRPQCPGRRGGKGLQPARLGAVHRGTRRGTPDQKAVRLLEVEGLSRSPMKTSTASSFDLAGLDGVVGVVQLRDLNPSEGEGAGAGRRSRWPRPPLSPTAMWRPLPGSGERAQGSPRPHGRDQLGVMVAALESSQLTQCRSAHDAVRRGGRHCAGTRPGPRPVFVTEDAVHPAGVEAQRTQSRCCSSATSSPRSIGVRR